MGENELPTDFGLVLGLRHEKIDLPSRVSRGDIISYYGGVME